MQLKTAVYVGHLSRFGIAFIDNILSSTLFTVQCIVLADEERWWKFKCKLSGVEDAKERHYLKKYFKSTTNRIIKKLRKQYPKLRIEIFNDANNKEAIMFAQGFEIILSAAFPQTFSESLISAVDGNIINFHPSYLPRCRGAHPIYWTIASGEEYGGVSSHFVVKEIDKGPLISRIKMPFKKDEITYDVLYQEAIITLPKVIKESEDFFLSKKIALIQDESDVTYFRNDRPIHRKIYWEKEESESIMAKIRAGNAFNFRNNGGIIYFFPPAKSIETGKLITNGYDEFVLPGTIVRVIDDVVFVKAKTEILILKFKLSKSIERLILNFLKKLDMYIIIDKLKILMDLELREGEILY